MDSRIKQITDSLQEMKGLLHGWDDAQDNIDAVLEKVETDPPTPKKMQELRRLVQGAISENIDNLETGETILKATAVVGIGAPVLYFAPQIAPKIFPFLIKAVSNWRTSLPWLASIGSSAATFVLDRQEKAGLQTRKTSLIAPPPYPNLQEGILFLLKNDGDSLFVEGVLDKIYGGVHLPEGITAVNMMLLNLFMRSDAIHSESKLSYSGTMHQAVRNYQERMQKNVDDLRPKIAAIKEEPQLDMQTEEFYLKSSVEDPGAVQNFLTTLRKEKEGLNASLTDFEQWGLQHWSPIFHKELQETVQEAREKMETAYGDFARIKYNLFHNGDYLDSAEQDFFALLGTNRDGQVVSDGYRVRIRSVGEVWRSDFSSEGAVWGFLAGQIVLNAGLSTAAKEVFKAQRFWSKAIPYASWVSAGLVVYPNIAAMVDANAEARPLHLKRN